MHNGLEILTVTSELKKQKLPNLRWMMQAVDEKGLVNCEIHQTETGAKAWGVWTYSAGDRSANRSKGYPKDPAELKAERGY